VSEVTEALQELHDGNRTLEDVAEFFRTRDWPSGPERPRPTTFKEAAAAEMHDRDEDPPGSFAEVADAYVAGTITLEQYTALAQAAAGKMNAQAGDQARDDRPAELREPGGQTARDDRTDRTDGTDGTDGTEQEET
jgi:hypothetical protein